MSPGLSLSSPTPQLSPSSSGSPPPSPRFLAPATSTTPLGSSPLASRHRATALLHSLLASCPPHASQPRGPPRPARNPPSPSGPGAAASRPNLLCLSATPRLDSPRPLAGAPLPVLTGGLAATAAGDHKCRDPAPVLARGPLGSALASPNPQPQLSPSSSGSPPPSPRFLAPATSTAPFGSSPLASRHRATALLHSLLASCPPRASQPRGPPRPGAAASRPNLLCLSAAPRLDSPRPLAGAPLPVLTGGLAATAAGDHQCRDPAPVLACGPLGSDTLHHTSNSCLVPTKEEVMEPSASTGQRVKLKGDKTVTRAIQLVMTMSGTSSAMTIGERNKKFRVSRAMAWIVVVCIPSIFIAITAGSAYRMFNNPIRAAGFPWRLPVVVLLGGYLAVVFGKLPPDCSLLVYFLYFRVIFIVTMSQSDADRLAAEKLEADKKAAEDAVAAATAAASAWPTGSMHLFVSMPC
nr:translation initiation factor IF-2-like [Aegilops tauschii subsp. strangulata]